MTDNRNTILAVVLSGLVLLGWQVFFNNPQMEKRRAAEQIQSELVKPHAGWQRHHPADRRGADAVGQCPRDDPARHVGTRGQPRCRHRRAPRVKIDTPRLIGSISLRGARIDDLSLVQFRETVDPASPAIVCCFRPRARLNPITRNSAGSQPPARPVKIPDQNTLWQQEGSGSLAPNNPVTLNTTMATASPSAAPFRSTSAISFRSG